NKMSKSLGNYIGITEPPEQIFGKTLSISDELMFRWYELLSDLPIEEIATLRKGMAEGWLHPKAVKVRLAKELVARFYDQEAADAAEKHFEQVFKQRELPDEIPEKILPAQADAVALLWLLKEAGLVDSTSDGRRMIQQNAVTVNGEKAADVNLQLLASGEVLLKVGKRRFCKVIFA
ncbi:tyrosine--tRNA ligase, partial [Desulfobulbus sp. F4]|nr:tyrosine--tRNA ligase [Desulfobulbus sp. F4]